MTDSGPAEAEAEQDADCRFTGVLRLNMRGRSAVLEKRDGRLWLRVSLRDAEDAQVVGAAAWDAAEGR